MFVFAWCIVNDEQSDKDWDFVLLIAFKNKENV